MLFRVLIAFFSTVLLFLLSGCKKEERQQDDGGTKPILVSVQPLSGPKGTAVEVIGRHFLTDPLQVSAYVGLKRIQPYSLTDTLLKFTLPPRCGSGYVVISMGTHSLTGPWFNYQYTFTLSHFSGVPGVSGYNDGDATSALFNSPRGLTIDNNGVIHVADVMNHTIRRVFDNGSVVTLAGNGTAGFDDDYGSAARFNTPADVELDTATGMLYVADRMNHLIRRVTPSGDVSTVAGLPAVAGYVDGAALAGRLNQPAGIALTSSPLKLYFADAANHCIRKIDQYQVLSTLAGTNQQGYLDAYGTGARFGTPLGIDFDTLGFLYVTDSVFHNIRRVDISSSQVTTVAGTGVPGWGDGNGAVASFNTPAAITSRLGQVLVCDGANHRIRRIGQDGMVVTVAGDGMAGYLNGVGTGTRLSSPAGIVRNPEGDYFISDTQNHCIRKLVMD